MRNLHVLALAAIVAALAVPQDASAQIADRMRRERLEREWDRYDRQLPGRARGGPAFCRSGRGHPVHGRRWCVDKGFALGGWGWERRYDDYRWERARWGDVVFRDRRYRRRHDDRYDRRYDDRYDRRYGDRYDRRYDDRYDRRYDDRYDRRYDGGWLRDVVGDIVFGRLTTHSRSLGWNDGLVGEWFDGGWFDDDRARVLTVYSGAQPLAELIDRDGDGRVEDIRLIRVR